ncbi:MAG: RES domain-containing protein [Pleurocapsa sp. SU_5_0]|nr:RES domain-containing protein [Pleurocapsa sp. SU_5_0]NJO97890.1 RES domain-containing protein [Pleurocapsa sp. CRU_1_2]
MVEIRYPPPTRNISPQWFELKPGTTIQRIFDSTSYGATPTGFRYYGPLSRFDHHNSQKPEIDKERGIIYAGLSLSCCLIKIFGDDETIKIQQQKIAYITLKQSLKLLNLRESGAWDAGSVSAMAVDGRRKLTQAWSRYFYENLDLYGDLDGVIFSNAHDSKPAIALYERAASKLLSADVSILDLNEPTIRETVMAIATRLNLLVEIEL